MSKADIVLLIMIAFGAFSGYRNGFLMSLISLLAIVLGVLGGFKLMGLGMIYLQNHFNADKTVLPYLSFFVIFIIIVVAVSLMGKAIKATIDKTFLGRMDQALGLVLGILKTMFMLSIALWILDSLKWSPKAEWTEGSWLYPFTAKLAPEITAWLGSFIPVFREIFRQY